MKHFLSPAKTSATAGRSTVALTTLALVLLLPSCQNNTNTTQSSTTATVQPSIFNPAIATPPHPEKKPKELVSASGDIRSDEYYWLNERENPAVKAYLEAENRYADSVLAPVANLREKLVRRTESPHQGRRFHGALFQKRILVYRPLRNRERIPHFYP